MCECVVRENINLYADNYYHAGNAWGLYHCYRANGEVDSFTCYIKGILSAEDIYRVLWDVKSCTIGENYLYSISDENLSVCLDDIALIKKLVEKNPPKVKTKGLYIECTMFIATGSRISGAIKGLPLQQLWL